MSQTGIISNYLEAELIDHIFKGEEFYPPYPFYIALYYKGIKGSTGDPGDDDSGTEMIGAGYARKTIGFYTSTSASSLNYNLVEFPVATGDWATVYGFGIRSSASAGNLLFRGLFDSPITITTGQNLRIFPYTLTLTLQAVTTASPTGGWTADGAHSAIAWVTNAPSASFDEPLNGFQVALARDVTVDSYGNLTAWTEISGSSYSRKVIPASSSSWNDVSNNSVRNANEIVFTTKATENWGFISHIVLYDNNTGIDPILWGKLASAVTVNVGDGFKIAANGITITID